ncbi:MAG: hypothetical protein KatS3mg011_0319 [Acidimicrobiia bacterium]|nr:MAG: hypothetical protein KatS3mg011_0319 [Acidimicrobiia bacterium]
MFPRVAILGIGAMGEALAAGLLAAGWAPDRVVAAARRETRRAEVERRLGIRCSLDVREAVDGAEIVVVAVKPRDVAGLVSVLRGALHPSQVLVSLAAGIPTSTYEQGAGRDPGGQGHAQHAGPGRRGGHGDRPRIVGGTGRRREGAQGAGGGR